MAMLTEKICQRNSNHALLKTLFWTKKRLCFGHAKKNHEKLTVRMTPPLTDSFS